MKGYWIAVYKDMKIENIKKYAEKASSYKKYNGNSCKRWKVETIEGKSSQELFNRISNI